MHIHSIEMYFRTAVDDPFDYNFITFFINQVSFVKFEDLIFFQNS